jgi:hypothetical protein
MKFLANEYLEAAILAFGVVALLVGLMYIAKARSEHDRID